MFRITRLNTHGLLNDVMIWAKVDLARKFDLTRGAVSYVAQRGEEMAKERDYQLEIRVI